MSNKHTLTFSFSYLLSPLFVFLGATVTNFDSYAAGSKGHLYVPYSLITNQLEKDFHSGSPFMQGQIPTQTINIEGLSIQFSPIKFDLKATVKAVKLNGKGFSAQVPNVSANITIPQISINQTITQDLGGAIINVVVQATCGPIVLTQNKASMNTAFALDWATGAPVTHLSSMDLNWAPNSWKVSSFNCQGPNNLPDVVKDQITKALADANEFKPILGQFMATKIQSFLDDSLNKLRAPFAIAEGKVQMPIQIGALDGADLGIVAVVLFNNADPAQKTNAPSAATLAALPQDRPSLIAGLDLLEQAASDQLALQPDDSILDLNTIPEFHSLLKSCLIELFVWPDLMNYRSSTPFYLRVHNPKSLSLQVNDKHELTSKIPLYATVQSWRDKQWWSYMIVNGTATATVQVTVAEGSMNYATTISQPNVMINYGEAYAARYRPGSFPKDQLINAVAGPASQLSGTMQWPDIDLGSAGTFGLQSLKWLDKDSFTLSWKQK